MKTKSKDHTRKTEKSKRLEKTIRKNGYYYVLVEVQERKDGYPLPCWDGNYGYALKTCRKITD